jgi:hypothetical protein
LEAIEAIGLLSIVGEVKLARKVFSPEMTLDVESLPAGVYVLQAQSKSGEKRSIRFVKQ